jgi:hypothetical protein
MLLLFGFTKSEIHSVCCHEAGPCGFLWYKLQLTYRPSNARLWFRYRIKPF